MEIKKILVLFKTHLDIGFTDFSANIVNNYIENYIPAAVKTSKELKKRGGKAQFLWTTGSWLIEEYLHRVSEKDAAEVIKAIEDGDIAWHGLPFTTHTELMGADLFKYGLSLSKKLDERFGKKTIAAKMTDVPGHTKAMIPYLKEAGIEFLHLGVNPTSAVPEVPELFRWQSDNGDKITVMYNKAYGDFAPLGDTGVAIYFAHTGDNHGGQTPEQVEEIFNKLSEEYPEAQLVAANLNDVALVLREIEDTLPVLTDEIGDSWIHGVGTDPKKVSMLRGLQRFAPYQSERDKDILYRGMLMVPEHTWGLNEMVNLADNYHYSREEFEQYRKLEHYKRFEASWAEQRAYLTDAIFALEPYPRREAFGIINDTLRPKAKCDGMKRIPVAKEIVLGEFLIKFNKKGEIVSLEKDGRVLADKDNRLCTLLYEQFSYDDYLRRFGQYNRLDVDWAREDFRKEGMHYGVDDHYDFEPEAVVFANEESVVVRYTFDRMATERFGCPESFDLIISADENQLRFDLAWFNKPANRMAEALWFGFNPKAENKRISKLGQWIDVSKTVKKGGKRLHATDYGVDYDILTIETVDAALVSPQEPSLLNFTQEEPKEKGIYFNLYNNIWGTNFPMWYEDDARFRFNLMLK